MFWESGIISSIKSGRVPRGCSAYVLVCLIRVPAPHAPTRDERTPFSFFLSLSLSQRDSLDPPYFHDTRLCLGLYVPSYPISFLLSHSFFICWTWNGTEQVDNPRIMQNSYCRPLYMYSKYTSRLKPFALPIFPPSVPLTTPKSPLTVNLLTLAPFLFFFVFRPITRTQ